MTKTKHFLGFTAALGVAALSLGTFSPAAAAGNTLVVNAGAQLRPVTHVAAGGLYALSSPGTPDAAQLGPLHLHQLTQPPADNLQAGGAGDVLKNSSTIIGAGAQSYIRMPDIYPDFPYKWVSWDDWLGKVDTMVRARLAATSTTNLNGWEIWNEPNWTWDTADAGPFNDGWTRTVREVKSLDKVTPIVGPSIDRWDATYMRSFLTQAKADGTLPDVVSWHELVNGYADIDEHVAEYRSIESQLGISPRPISINEYAWTDQVDVPAQALHYISQFERAGVNDAERAFWYESGTVNGLLYKNKPTASYWMYKWYGDMAGNMLPVAASGDLDGIASLDSTRKVANVVFGGAAGSNSVKVTGLTAFGNSVRVTVSSTPNSGRQTNVAAPTVISSTTSSVTNGTVTVPINNMDAGAAYQIVVTPAAGPVTSYQQVYEAENATVVNGTRYAGSSASNGWYVGGLDNSGDERNDSFVDFLVTVPTAGSYSLKVRYANGGTSASTQGLASNGGAWSTVSYAPTGGWGQFAVAQAGSVPLNAGVNVIRLAKGTPGFVGGSGYAELDSITITK